MKLVNYKTIQHHFADSSVHFISLSCNQWQESLFEKVFFIWCTVKSREVGEVVAEFFAREPEDCVHVSSYNF